MQIMFDLVKECGFICERLFTCTSWVSDRDRFKEFIDGIWSQYSASKHLNIIVFIE